MGFSLRFLPFFDAIHTCEPFKQPWLSLGSQEIHDPPQDIYNYAKANGYSRLMSEGSLASLLHDHYKISHYVDLDLNKKSEINADLNLPLANEILNRWMTIFDGGTLEHVFDLASALKNIHQLCAIDGVIVHVSPLTWLDHGFCNLTPRLFKALAQKNGYKILSEAYCFPSTSQKLPESHYSNVATQKLPTEPSGLVLIRIKDSFTENSSIIAKLQQEGFFPLNALYCIAYQKTYDKPFAIPYDVH